MEQVKMRKLPMAGAWIWSLRLFGLMGPFLLVGEWLLPFEWMPAVVFLWLLIYLALACWYFPLRYRNACYGMTGQRLVLQGGFFYHSRRMLRLGDITGSVIFQSPLQKLFGVAVMGFFLPSKSLWLDGILVSEARFLAEEIALQRMRKEELP